MNILLGVTGSISAYKSLDLLRLLLKKGHQVKIMLSKGALKFVRKETYSYLGAAGVYTDEDDFAPRDETHQNPNQILHIELARWCHCLAIAPMSAQKLAEITHGMASDLIGCASLALSSEKPLLLFPAMNTQMWLNPVTQRNLKSIENIPHIFVHPPQAGVLACGETGAGRLPEVEHLAECIPLFSELFPLKKQMPQENPIQHVLITAGATLSPLDPVRFLTNGSTGLMGHYLALCFLYLGLPVTLISTSTSTGLIQELNAFHNPCKLITVHTTAQMKDAVLENFPACSHYISTAAISDIVFATTSEKLKKEALAQALPIERAPDILKAVFELRRPHQTIVGFSAETNLDPAMLSQKWSKKPADLVIANRVSHGKGLLHASTQADTKADKEADSTLKGFGATKNHYQAFSPSGALCPSKISDSSEKPLSKAELSRLICEVLLTDHKDPSDYDKYHQHHSSLRDHSRSSGHQKNH